MNIFALHDAPTASPRCMTDAHIVVMPKESAQMLSAAVLLNLEFRHAFGYYEARSLYKLTHCYHPSSRWARNNLANFQWLVEHGFALCDEYQHRFGRPHDSRQIIERVSVVLDRVTDNSCKLTPFAMAMPVQYQTSITPGDAPDPVLSYRLYYLGEKVLPDSSWTNRDRADLPSWLSRKVLSCP